ncbi:enoyl-CoA hydratase/isomerase family protein [Thermobifida cellulosilytica]|uniref:Enoyl-CoA hydratase n=1 Tax=Thermobifida cellulosilytica TB100 TaxID=665004 RepID=A0A147KKP0_THECS|nr:enoyl-CoA hydratase-related protein [Thermobifida cellulosilytica]KUP97791.1 enoyl-CoA hydratase [Thermobifida cellulosilytica TB100]
MSGVRCAVDGGVARITLARPEASNSVDMATARAFGEAVDQARDPSVRAVLVTGEGPRFCAGGDVASMAAAEDRSAYLHELAAVLGGELLRLAELDKPVVAAVHGAVAGAGLAFVLTADLVVAARSTRFLMAYSGVGLTPDCGVSYLLPRAVGQQRALEMALLNRALTAAEALEWGLVTQVVEDDEALGRAEEIAARLAAGPAFALGQAKRLIRGSWETTPQQSVADEAATIGRAITTGDAARLIDAFLRR